MNGIVGNKKENAVNKMWEKEFQVENWCRGLRAAFSLMDVTSPHSWW